MKILRKNIIYIVVALFLSSILFLWSLTNVNTSFILSIEIFIISFCFICIFFIYKDRFNVFTFLLINSLLGVLDIIFVALKIRMVQNYHSIHIYEKALFMIILWFLTFIVTYKILSKKGLGIKFTNTINKIFNYTNIKMLIIIVGAIYLFVVYKVLMTIIQIGDISLAMENSTIFRYNNQGYLATLISLTAILPICFLEINKNKMAYFSLGIMMVILFLTGRRGLIINSLIIPILVYYNYRKKTITNKQLIMIGIPVMAIVLVLGGARGQAAKTSSSNDLVETLTNLTVSSQMGENLPDLIYAIDSNIVEKQYFKYLDRGFIGLIPRAIWNNKPELIDHSMIVGKLIYNNSTYGRPVGSFGFAYFCFGFFGIIAFAIITSIVAKKFYYWMIENKNCISIFMYAILINYILNIAKPESVMNIIAIFLILIFTSLCAKAFKNNKLNLKDFKLIASESNKI